MPRKVLLNRRYGGFNLSEDAKKQYMAATQHVPKDRNWYANTDIVRDDPVLIEIVEKMGLVAAAGMFSSLIIVEIPDDVPEDGWIIEDYDGMEWVAEKHRTWCGNE
jgi:hypothetical protein